MRTHRAGQSFVELAVAGGLLALLIGALVGLHFGSARSSRATVESAEAVRSALVALERIRADVRRTYYADAGRDVAVLDGGCGLSVRTVRPVPGDPWRTVNVPVTYRLEPMPGGSASRLVRDENGVRATVGGVVLSALSVQFRSAPHPALDITAVGTSGTPEGRAVSVSERIPVPMALPPQPYEMPGVSL